MPVDPRILENFRGVLRRSGLSEAAVDHYLGVVRRGLTGGDLLAVLYTARSPSAAKMARAAILRWARWRRDRTLAAALPDVPYIPIKPSALRCTPAMRDKLIAAIANLPDRERPVFEIGFRTIVKIGTLLAHLSRTSVLRLALLPSAVIFDLQTRHDWKYLGDLLAKTPGAAYATYRRRLSLLCAQTGLPRLRPNDLRLLAVHEAAANRKGDR